MIKHDSNLELAKYKSPTEHDCADNISTINGAGYIPKMEWDKTTTSWGIKIHFECSMCGKKLYEQYDFKGLFNAKTGKEI